MSTEKIFLRSAETYKQDIAPVRHWVELNAIYLTKLRSITMEAAQTYLWTKVKSNTFNKKMTNPTVVYYDKDFTTGDRHEKSCSMTAYIEEIIADKDTLAPTLTSYVNRSKRQSFLATTITKKAKARKVVKKAMFLAIDEGRTKDAAVANEDQTVKKLDQNIYSGLFNAGGSVLYNPSGHSTLTSTTRTITCVGNGSNELLLAGARLYLDAETVMGNILNVCHALNDNYGTGILRDRMFEVMRTYHLHYPTTEEAMQVVRRSASMYFTAPEHYEHIEDLLRRLEPIERAAFCYINDLYHIRKFNGDFVKHFLETMSKPVIGVFKEEMLTEMKTFDEELLHYVHRLHMDELKGIGKDYTKLSTTGYDGLVASIYHTYHQVNNFLQDRQSFIDVFFKTDVLPPNVANVPHMVRFVTVMGDTDSTCSSADEWVEWWNGEIVFTKETRCFALSALLMASQTMRHKLAVQSANFGLTGSDVFELSMKGEFYWEVFAPTDVSKTYYADAWYQEGSVFAKSKLERKGVNLKNSNSPERVRAYSEKLMKDILHAVGTNQGLGARDILGVVAEFELSIVHALRSGDREFYRSININSQGSYSLGDEASNFRHHMFWQDTFAHHYGVMVEPPYKTVKVSTMLDNRTRTNDWIANIANRDLADRIKAWLIAQGRVEYPTMYIPVAFVQNHGLPKEVADAIDIKGIILDLCNMLYIILSTLRLLRKPGQLVYEMLGLTPDKLLTNGETDV